MVVDTSYSALPILRVMRLACFNFSYVYLLFSLAHNVKSVTGRFNACYALLADEVNC